MAGGWDGGHLNPGETHNKHSIVMHHYNKCAALLEPLTVLAGFIKNQTYHVRGRNYAPTDSVKGLLFGNALEELDEAIRAHGQSWAQAASQRGVSPQARARMRDRAQWLLAHTEHLRKLLHHFEEVLLQDLPLWRAGMDGAPAIDWLSAYTAALRPELQQRWEAHCMSTAAHYAAQAQTFARGAAHTGAGRPPDSSWVRVVCALALCSAC